MTITPGALRALTQPTILLRMDRPVAAAPGNPNGPGEVFGAGTLVFAQYIGNGRLLLTPVTTSPHVAQVVMASALNDTSTILPQADLIAMAIVAHAQTTMPAEQDAAAGWTPPGDTASEQAWREAVIRDERQRAQARGERP